MTISTRDHGGGIDGACQRFGGSRIAWLDLSTGINPQPYPVPVLSQDAWTALPDQAAIKRLTDAARAFWNVPSGADILATPGASIGIAQIPSLKKPGRVVIPTPTYNEHAAAFETHGWQVSETQPTEAQVVVHPNNPDGKRWTSETLPLDTANLTVIDESFCDVTPDDTLIDLATQPNTLVLKSFGKFWGLAGLRLGFVIGPPDLIDVLRRRLGPWTVAGPALEIGAKALADFDWAQNTRLRLHRDSDRLDTLMRQVGAQVAGGTSLFRLYRVEDAAEWQTRLAQHHIWSRVFPYNPHWLRLGLPSDVQWPRLEAALA